MSEEFKIRITSLFILSDPTKKIFSSSLSPLTFISRIYFSYVCKYHIDFCLRVSHRQILPSW